LSWTTRHLLSGDVKFLFGLLGTNKICPRVVVCNTCFGGRVSSYSSCCGQKPPPGHIDKHPPPIAANSAQGPNLRQPRSAMGWLDPKRPLTAISPATPTGRCWPVCDRRVRRSRPAWQDYTSVCSAISSASSTSIPRYLTVLSSLCPAGHSPAREIVKLRVPEQELNGPEIPGPSVDQRCFRASQRVRAVGHRVQSN
jgi:hypothetical protein